jgi:hypothetical protein
MTLRARAESSAERDPVSRYLLAEVSVINALLKRDFDLMLNR